MFRRQYPDLDVLESPLISANPFGSTLGEAPGSAIAERIFNDPGSWHDSDEESIQSGDAKDPMAWLADELDKFSSDEMSLSPIERSPDITLRPFSGRFKLMPKSKPTLGLPRLAGLHTTWEGVVEDEKRPFLPIFERSGLDLSLDLNLRLSKVWETGGNIFHSFPSPVTFSPPPSPTPDSEKPLSRLPRAGVTALELETIMEQAPTPIISPMAVASASTTWSILELYGIPPVTPALDSGRTLFGPYPPTPLLPVPQVPKIPPSLKAASTPPPATSAGPTAPLLTLPSVPGNETVHVRKLPVIPDIPRNSPCPSRINTPEPMVRGAPLSHPLPQSSCSNSSSPAVTPQSIRPASASRSPPAGPRPRSDTQPSMKQRQNSGRESPFTISPAPRSMRRSPSPPSRVLSACRPTIRI